MQGIEGVEKFLLGADLTGDKLNIVHQQHVHLPVFGAEFRRLPLLDGLDQLIGDIFPLGVDDLHIGGIFLNLVADGVEQVGFSQSGAAVYK